MTFEEASERFKLPLKVLFRLHGLGIVKGIILTEADANAIEVVSRIYGDTVLLRSQISRMSKSRRENLIRTAEMAKWERYVVNRYMTHIAERSGGRLYVSQVADEIGRYYGIAKSPPIIRRIYQLRKKAYKELERSLKSTGSCTALRLRRD